MHLSGVVRPTETDEHKMRHVPRRGALIAFPALFVCPLPVLPDDFSTQVRRTVVRGAQLADAADGVWQQFAGEVQAPWQKQQQLGPDSVPPAFLDASTARELLTLPLEAGARCAKLSVDSLLAKLPAARQQRQRQRRGRHGPTSVPQIVGNRSRE